MAKKSDKQKLDALKKMILDGKASVDVMVNYILDNGLLQMPRLGVPDKYIEVCRQVYELADKIFEKEWNEWVAEGKAKKAAKAQAEAHQAGL